MVKLYLFAALALPLAGQTQLPGRQPTLTAAGRQVAVAYGDKSSVFVTLSTDGGRTFRSPVKVAEVPNLMLGRHRGPRIAISEKGLVLTAVSGDPNGSLLAWRSTDRGATWKGPVTVNDQPRAAREGLHSMATGKHGDVGVVWLDLRTPGTKIYGAYSSDGGATWSKNALLYASPGGTVCQCCDPSLAAASSEGFAVMFRNVIDGNRDLYAFRWTPGRDPGPAHKLGDRTWQFNACPMDGGGVVDTSNGRLVSAWRRDHDVFLAAEGQPEIKLGEGKDVALASTAAGPFVSWVDATGAVVLQKPGQLKPETVAPKGAYPALAALPDGRVLLAWEEGETIRSEIVTVTGTS